MVDEGLTLAEIVRLSDKSNTTIRYWLKKYGLKPRKFFKTAPIWSLSKDDLQGIISSSSSLKEAFLTTHSTQSFSSGAYSRFKIRLKDLNIDTSKLLMNKSKFNNCSKARLLSEVLVKNSTYSRNSLKRRIIKDNLLKYKCHLCSLEPVWRNKTLSLRLDHINGIPNDNRLCNLRFLCPNCDSQTKFFSKRNDLRLVSK